MERNKKARAAAGPGVATVNGSLTDRITAGTGAQEAGRCMICGRALRDPRSVTVSMGPVCERKARRMEHTPAAGGGPTVTVNGRPLHHVVRHSPTGFEWGYGGSGPADLARSILLDYLSRCGRDIRCRQLTTGPIGRKGREQIADALYQAYKWQVVAGLPHDRWQLTGDQVATWLRSNGVDVPALPVVYEGRRTA